MIAKIFWIFICILVLGIVLEYLKKTLVYQPTVANSEKYEKFYEKLSQLSESQTYNYGVTTRDGIILDTIYIKNRDTNKCIIFFHGNAGNISMRFDMINFLYNYASVIIFDYRAFGKSTGGVMDLSSKNLQHDAAAIWDFATTILKIEPNNISLVGESLGCSVAITYTAFLSQTMNDKNYPHSLICISPFYSLPSMVNVVFSKLNVGLLGRFFAVFANSDFRSDKLIRYINHQTKIILAHSPRDEIVPHSEGLRLYNCIKDTHINSKFINISGTHNNTAFTDSFIYELAAIFD